ncbi:hypothetical protein IAR50_004286 [Cryptococcus sp. DSM 104548]
MAVPKASERVRTAGEGGIAGEHLLRRLQVIGFEPFESLETLGQVGVVLDGSSKHVLPVTGIQADILEVVRHLQREALVQQALQNIPLLTNQVFEAGLEASGQRGVYRAGKILHVLKGLQAPTDRRGHGSGRRRAHQYML